MEVAIQKVRLEERSLIHCKQFDPAALDSSVLSVAKKARVAEVAIQTTPAPQTAAPLATGRVSKGNLFALLFEILKLLQRSKELQQQFRSVLRNEYLSRIDNLVRTLEAQANAIRSAAISAGMLGIGAGIAGALGPLAGGWVFDTLDPVLRWFNINDVPEAQRFKILEVIPKAMDQLSNIAYRTGEVQTKLLEGSLKLEEAHAHLSQEERQRCSDLIREFMQASQGYESAALEILRMERETNR